MIVRYHEHAQKEIAQITRYYVRERPELGAEFSAELNSAIDTILSDPLRFEQVRLGVRRFLLDRFPYGVCYRMPDADTVQVIVAKHHSRQPGLGMRRI